MTERLLSIRPVAAGFGFAALEDPKTLVDWGLKEEKASNVGRSLGNVRKLIAVNQPLLLVIEDLSGSGNRSPRSHELVDKLLLLAKEIDLKVVLISRRAARKHLDPNAPMKQYRLTHLIAERFPELKRRLPPYRKIYMSQDPRFALFEAVALGLAAFGDKLPESENAEVERTDEDISEM